MVDFFQVNGVASGTWAQASHTLHYHRNSTYPSLISSTFQNVFCTGNLSQSFFEKISGSLWPHPLLASFQWSGFFNQQMLLLTETTYRMRNGAPAERCGFYTHLCLQGEKKSSQSQPRPFHSHPGPPPCARHVLNTPTYLPLSHLFC